MFAINSFCILAVLSQAFAAKPSLKPFGASTDLELRKHVFSKIGLAHKEGVTSSEVVSKALRVQSYSDTPSDVGYVIVNYYFNYPTTAQCKGSDYTLWLKYGVCIISGDGTDSYNSTVAGPATDGSYTVTTNVFRNPECNENGGAGILSTTTDTGFINECDGSGYGLMGFTDTYTPPEDGINFYNYNSLNDCQAGGYGTVISASNIPTDECIPADASSVKYNDCYTYSYYEGTTDCNKKTATSWSETTGSTDLFSQTTCSLNTDDDDDNYYDDSQQAVEYSLSYCNSKSSAASSVASVAQFSMIGVVVSTVLVFLV